MKRKKRKPFPAAWKIAFGVAFTLTVAVFTARGCMKKGEPPPSAPVRTARPAKPAARPKPKPKPVYKAPETAPKPVRVPHGEAELAIVLDDWGRKYGVFKDALALERPVTFAVIPHLPYSTRIAREARAAGHDVIVHFPMQPKTETHVEPTTIRTDTPDAVIRRRLDEAFRSVAGAQGMNNHQGSAATSDLRVMRTVLGYLKSRGVFFLDSNVISTTVGPRVAREIGLPFAKRDVFLDNELDEEAIVVQLRKAKKVALSHGAAVAIGHDHEVTVEAVRRMIPELERDGVRLVHVSALLEEPGDVE